MERPFTSDLPEEVLDDLRDRQERTRWIDATPHGLGWTTGTDARELRQLCDYWCHEYIWREQEAALNRLPQFVRRDVDGIDTHDVHVRSPHPHPSAILTHEWPSTFAEFRDVVLALADPVAYGGRAVDAFHFVCPSIPHLRFSAAPAALGFTIERVGRHVSHFVETLGYSRYGAQGTDWGSIATCWMAINNPEPPVGIHLSTMHVPEPAHLSITLTGADLAKRQRRAEFHESGVAYARVQGTRPECLALGINDSPSGLAAWILEKYYRRERWAHRGSGTRIPAARSSRRSPSTGSPRPSARRSASVGGPSTIPCTSCLTTGLGSTHRRVWRHSHTIFPAAASVGQALGEHHSLDRVQPRWEFRGDGDTAAVPGRRPSLLRPLRDH